MHNRPVFTAGSEGEASSNLARKHGLKYIECKNFPVSNKHNKLVESLRDVDFDYAVILGSDNLVSKNFTEKMEQVLTEKKPDFLQLKGLYFYNQKTKKTTYYNGFTGVGRCFSKNVLEALDYKLWSDGLNSGLDTSSLNILETNGYKPFEIDIRDLGVEVVDVKYRDNITSHSVTLKGKAVDRLSIDLSEVDKLTRYSAMRNSDSKLRVKNIMTGETKFLSVSIAKKMIERKKYKLI
jgi:hypothetical protein